MSEDRLQVGKFAGWKVWGRFERQDGMSTFRRFEDIEAWQTARKLTGLIYEFSKEGEFARDFGLRDQMRRASVSILSNIAEGFESRTPGLFVEFLGRPEGSAGELRAQLYVPADAGYLSHENIETWQR